MDNNKKELILNKIMGLGFVGYFFVLLLERILALIFSFKGSFNSDAFLMSTYIISIVSVVIGFIILVKPIGDIIIRSIKNVEYDFGHNYKQLILGSMVLLVSGMMATEWTYPIIQFVAYGLLIVSMIIRTYFSIKEGNDSFKAIMSVIYLTCFSMAIPVCHATKLAGALGISFYVVEFVTVFVLIPCFGLMLFNFFLEGVSKFQPWILFIVTILSGLVIGLKWTEEVNIFVLIALSLTIVSYLVYIVKTLISKKK